MGQIQKIIIWSIHPSSIPLESLKMDGLPSDSELIIQEYGSCIVTWNNILLGAWTPF
uniref:Uncharacterized protein n=1 Tax=Vitis vinifera TaxID=29760 RepID=F6HVW6_VITVI